MDDQVSSLLQVCDGKTFWNYCKLRDQGTLTRLDAVRAARALAQAAAGPNRNFTSLLPGLGGMSKLLRGLDANFRFVTVQEDGLGALRVWKLKGGWQTAQLINLLPKQKDAIQHGKPADLSRLPPYLPDRVVLWLGTADLFPRRIEYRRGTAKPGDPSDAGEDRALVTMDLDGLTFNAPIDPARFYYNPGNVEAVDQTKRLPAIAGREGVNSPGATGFASALGRKIIAQGATGFASVLDRKDIAQRRYVAEDGRTKSR